MSQDRPCQADDSPRVLPTRVPGTKTEDHERDAQEHVSSRHPTVKMDVGRGEPEHQQRQCRDFAGK